MGSTFASVAARIEAADDPDQALVERTIELIGASDAGLADVVRACAIPRRIDSETVGVLRNAEQDADENERILDALAQHGLVVTREDGGYRVRDEVRRPLLRTWRDAAHRTEFEAICDRLVRHYRQLHLRVAEAEQDAAKVGDVLLRVSPDRFTQLTSLLERRLVSPLVEALRYQWMISPASGLELLASCVLDYERRGRPRLASVLVAAARRHQAAERDEPAPWVSAWLDYWDGRLAHQLGRLEDAERLLRAASDAAPDPELTVPALDELAAVLLDQTRFRDSQRVLERMLAVATGSSSAWQDEPRAHVRLGNLHTWLDDLDAAVRSFQRAIELARERDDADLLVTADLHMSEVLQRLGQWEAAAHHALEALDVARLRLPGSLDRYVWIASRAAGLWATRSQPMLEATAAESEVLASALGGPIASLGRRVERVELLRRAGRLRSADRLAGRLERSAARSGDRRLAGRFREIVALLRRDQGRLVELLASHSGLPGPETAADMPPWYVANLRLLLGIASVGLGRWAEADIHLRAAAEAFRGSDHAYYAALATVVAADAARRQGLTPRAQALLDDARSRLQGARPMFAAAVHEAQAAIHGAQALWAEAALELERGVAAALASEDEPAAARMRSALAAAAAAQGDWELAERAAAAGSGTWRALASRDAPTSRGRARAEAANGHGLALFSRQGEDRTRLTEARELFRSARRRAPGNAWYSLNFAYCCAALEAWSDAAEALEAALGCEPLLRLPPLHARLAHLRLRQAEAELGAGRPRSAQRTLGLALERLRGLVPPELAGRLAVRRSDAFMLLGKYDEAGASLEGDDGATRARRGLLAAFGGEVGEAAAQLRRALAELEDQAGGPGRRLAAECAPLVTSTGQLWAADRALRALAEDANVPPLERHRASGARLELSRLCYRRLLRPADRVGRPGPAGTLPEPVVVEIGAGLLPATWQAGLVNRALEAGLPAMRQRIQEATGVAVPGIRLRPGTGRPDGYVLLLSEVPRVVGRVPPGWWFCADEGDCRAARLHGVGAERFGGTLPGRWVPAAATGRATAAGVELYDAMEYVLRELEELLLGNLASFIGAQVDGLLHRWIGDDDDRRQLARSALPDDPARSRFARQLRRLVAERVPVTDLGPILAHLDTAGLIDDDELGEAIRLALRRLLPVSSRRLLQLSPDVERLVAEHVTERAGRRFLAMGRDRAAGIQGLVRAQVAALGGLPAAVVVREPGLRLFVRRLLEPALPSLPVLSAAELGANGPVIGPLVPVTWSSPAQRWEPAR